MISQDSPRSNRIAFSYILDYFMVIILFIPFISSFFSINTIFFSIKKNSISTLLFIVYNWKSFGIVNNWAPFQIDSESWNLLLTKLVFEIDYYSFKQ